MNLRKKLFLFFGSFFLLFCIGATSALYSLHIIYKDLYALYHNDFHAVERVLQADRDFHQALIAERMAFIDTDPSNFQKYKESHSDNVQQTIDRTAVVTEVVNPKGIDPLYADFQKKMNLWKQASNQFMEKIESASVEERLALASEFSNLDQLFDTARDPIDKIQEIKIARAKQRIEEGKAMYEFCLKFIFGVSIAGILLFLGAMFDLNKNVIRKLSLAISKLSTSSEEIGEHTNNLDATSNQLAAAANEQNASSHESVAAMEEMSSMVDQTKTYVTTSLGVVQDVNTSVVDGTKTLQSLLDSMEEINQSTEKIKDVEKIIEMIDEKTSIINDIVFKTQLLSFNASIEAARAGQHGRGFSVVAEEVSQLATVSGSAAQEIQDLLQESKQQVGNLVQDTSKVTEEGKKVTADVEELFQRIRTYIDSINDQMKGVDTASAEQGSGIRQTLEAMNQLNLATQQTSEVSQNLGEKSGELKDLQSGLELLVKDLRGLTEGRVKDKSIERPKASLANVKPAEVVLDETDDFDSDDDSFQRVS